MHPEVKFAIPNSTPYLAIDCHFPTLRSLLSQSGSYFGVGITFAESSVSGYMKSCIQERNQVLLVASAVILDAKVARG